jgi:hypothetical protein
MIIEVDGQSVGDGPLSWRVNRFVDAYFTADGRAVEEVLPSQLHPARWSPNRSVVTVMAVDWEWRVGPLTLCRSGDIAVAALVSRGETPSPPLLPLFRGMRVGGARDRFLGGSYILQTASTNWIARELWNQVYGAPGFVADLRYEVQPTFDRFVCEEDDNLIIDFKVSSTGRASTFSSGKERGFGIRNGTLIGVFSESSGTSRSRFGRSSAELRLGDHPITELFRDLSLSRPLVGSVWLEGEQRMVEPVRLFESATPRTNTYTGSEKLAGRLIANYKVEETELAQGSEDLPFDSAGELTVQSGERIPAK